jgi:hypothetical protein
MLVKLTQIVPNNYRDLVKQPLQRGKIDSLKESTKDTGAWRVMMGRPHNNVVPGVPAEELANYLKGLKAAFTDDGVPIFKVEIPYGHHRWQAWLEMGMEVIDIEVVPIEEKAMLQMMANENKNDWGSNMSVILETVRQTREFLFDTIKNCTTFEEYADQQGEDAFFTKEQFVQAKEQGLGYRSIRKFLGETWAEGDIRAAMGVLGNVESGLFTQEQIVNFPSVGVLGAFSKVAENIMAQPYAPYFKRKMIDDIADMVSNPKISTTVKVLKSAQDAAANGKDPVQVIKNFGGKRVDFKQEQALKDLVYQNMDPKAPKLEDIEEMDGFKGYEGLPALLEEVKKSIARSEAAAKGHETKEAVEGATTNMPSAPATGEAALSNDELEAAVAAAEGGKTTAAKAGIPDFPEVPAEGGGSSAMLVADRFTQSAAVMVAQITEFHKALDEIEGSDLPAFQAAHELLTAVAKLYVAIYDKADLQSVFDDAIA